MNVVGNRIKMRRQEIGMTQDEIRSQMGYTHRSSISKIERGAITLSSKQISEFAKCLRCKPELLLGCTNKEYKTYLKLENIRTGKEMGI